MKLLTESRLVASAYLIASRAHRGQKDKGDNRYILHPKAVAEMVEGEDAQAVALLHDVVEDTPVTLSDLSFTGFSAAIVSAVDAITKRKGEPLADYLGRVKANDLARTVKLADLKHNSDLSRIPEPREKDFQRVKRYAAEIEFLRAPDSAIFAF